MSELAQIALALLLVASLLVTTLHALWMRRQMQIVRGYLADARDEAREQARRIHEVLMELAYMRLPESDDNVPAESPLAAILDFHVWQDPQGPEGK